MAQRYQRGLPNAQAVISGVTVRIKRTASADESYLLCMTEKTYWETFKAESANVIDRLNKLIHEGNVRRVVVEHKGRTVAEFPLTAGVVGAVIAPVAATVGVLIAILQDCTIKVERRVTDSDESRSEPLTNAQTM